jgi:hypothetical protein
MPARDYLGQELEVGDMVVYIRRESFGFQKGVVCKIKKSDKDIFIKIQDDTLGYLFGHQVIKIGVLANE